MSNILIIDDQPVNRHFLATLLGYFDHEIVEAGDGGEALESLRNGKFDLVITDVLMPTMDGYDFVRQLRRDRRLSPVPVIFYSAANYEANARAMAEAHGVQHFLTKPAKPEDILVAVNSALGQGPVSRATLNEFNRHLFSAPADPIDSDAIVFVVDDDPAMRDFLTAIFREAGLRIEAYGTAEDFLQGYVAKPSSCLVLDLWLPGISGLALLETLRSRRIDIPTIILTGHGDTTAAVNAMRLGVLDFLEKPADKQILLARVYRALQQDSIHRREHDHAEEMRKRMECVTDREKDLLKLLALGKSSKEIAAELKISIKTVGHHRAHLMRKTRAKSLVELVRMSMIVFDE